MTRRTLTTLSGLHSCAASIANLPLQMLPIEIIVRPYRSRRNEAQNARLWAIHHQVSAALSLMGKPKWTAEDVHDFIFKPTFCGMAETNTGQIQVKRPRSSTELTVLEMAEAQTKYEHGIELDLQERENVETG